MSIPRVTVICIFLDEERFLGEAVDSVLAQDFADWELLLVDDGSSDGSSALARDYASRDPGRVRYLEHPGHENRGMSATRNLGFAHARGEFVAFMDADDRWRPARLREQVAILDAHPEVGMVCGTANYWQSWAGGEDRLVPTGHLVDAASMPPDTSLRLYPLGKADAPCDLLIRRELVERVGGKRCDLLLDLLRVPQVVAVEIGDVGRPREFGAKVAGGGHPGVRDRLDPHAFVRRGDALGNRAGCVGRSVVDDDDVELGIGLAHRAHDRALEE